MNKKKLWIRIMAWALSILMVGSTAFTLIYIIANSIH
jgi:hypothetical protein